MVHRRHDDGPVLLWIAGLLILCRQGLRQLRYTRRVSALSEPLREGGCGRRSRRSAIGWGSPAPDCAARGRADAAGDGPREPVVLIPRSGLERLTPAEVSMTLCHELVHLRRNDLWLGWVPALAHRIFFFHPLAALAAREYAIAREAACDAEVLRSWGRRPRPTGVYFYGGVWPRERPVSPPRAPRPPCRT